MNGKKRNNIATQGIETHFNACLCLPNGQPCITALSFCALLLHMTTEETTVKPAMQGSSSSMACPSPHSKARRHFLQHVPWSISTKSQCLGQLWIHTMSIIWLLWELWTKLQVLCGTNVMCMINVLYIGLSTKTIILTMLTSLFTLSWYFVVFLFY